MNEPLLLTVDGIINLVLGVLLIAFPKPVVQALGVPHAPGFYPSILGGVLLGIGIALFLERRGSGAGLGLDGAAAINLCGGLVLAGWLLFGQLAIPPRGYLLLWALVILLVGISAVEIFATTRRDSRFSTPGSPR